MGLHVAQMTGQAAMRQCFEAVTSTPARILGLEGHGLAVGCRADLVLLQARDVVVITLVALTMSFLATLYPAWRAARTDPAAKRVLNEAWLDRADHWGRGLRSAFLPLLDKLLDQGTPIDAIGLQCHLAPGNLDMDAFLQLVEQLQQRQLPVYITELDVNDQSFVDDEAQRDQQVASTYRDFLQEVLQNPVVEMVQTWQLSDKYSFYQGRQERLVRVLPFDRDMRAKPAYQALATTLAIPRHG